MKKAVEIEKNSDGTFSIYLYGRCTFTGTFEECNAEIARNAMYW